MRDTCSLAGAGGEVNCSKSPARWWARFHRFAYEEQTIEMRPGDLLIAYTDGITEPENAYGEEFGAERLAETALRTRTASRKRSWRRSWKL